MKTTYTPQAFLLTGTTRKDIDLYTFLANVDDYLTYLSNTSGSSNSAVVLADNVVTNAFTYTQLANTPGQLLVLVFRQDSTGYPISWGSNFINPPIIDTTPGTVSVAMFVARQNKTWMLAGVPILGIKI